MDCAYHPGRLSVNVCSRCGKHVCAGCNYITGTSPICRFCWEKIEIATAVKRSSEGTSGPSVQSNKHFGNFVSKIRGILR